MVSDQMNNTFDDTLATTKRVLTEFNANLTPQEIEALSYLLMKGRMTAGDISSHMNIDITRAYTILDSLVNKKLSKKVENRSPKTYLPLHPHYIFSELEKKLDSIRDDIQKIVPVCVQVFETSEHFQAPSLGDFLFTSEDISEIVSDIAPILKSAIEITLGGNDLSWIEGQTFLVERMNKASVKIYLSSAKKGFSKSVMSTRIIRSKKQLPDFMVIRTDKESHLVFLVRRLRPDGSFKIHGIRIVDSVMAKYFLDSLQAIEHEVVSN
jgi:predicted transcriptional regulator